MEGIALTDSAKFFPMQRTEVIEPFLLAGLGYLDLDGPGVLNEPQGVLVLPGEVADRVGYDVVVADSVNHQVKGLRLADGGWVALAGTGRQLRERSGSGPALRHWHSR